MKFLEGYSSEESDDVFSKERDVKELSESDGGFCKERKVKEETEDESIKEKEELLDEEIKERKTGPLRFKPKERLLSEEGLRAHRTGKFLDLNLKRRDLMRSKIEDMAEEEKATRSEGGASDFCPLVKSEYESEPVQGCEVTFKEMVKLPGATRTDEKVRTVSMTEEEFKEFLNHKAFKQEKLQKKLKKKAMIKRLKKRNFDLEREVRRTGLKRKL